MPSLPYRAKVALALRIWTIFAIVTIELRRQPLPALIDRLSRTTRSSQRIEARRLSRIVARSLRLGSHRPRCLILALVLYRLLRLQGEPAQLVIGLPEGPHDETAHAWVEIHGTDFGPLPGRIAHRELARYG